MDKKEQEQWNSAIKEEIKSFHERKVWDLVDLPKGHQSIKGRWVYAVKSNGHKKVCFVTKEFTQVFRIDYENTFSPVARFEILQLLLSLAALCNWELEALDVKLHCVMVFLSFLSSPYGLTISISTYGYNITWSPI